MIKFFRKIRYNLMEQNKTGKYLKYALGEIVLVVMGILIALSINNWNENRKNQKEETRILEQLHQEFLINKESLAHINTKNKAVLNSLNKILDLIPIEAQEINLESLSDYLFQSYDFNTFDPLQGSIEELKSNSFDIISNEKLRSLLLSWNTIREDFQDDEHFAIDYAKIYNTFMQKFASIDFGLEKPNTDLSFLQSIEFENFVRVRQIYYTDIVDSDDFKRVEFTINNIIEMTKSE